MIRLITCNTVPEAYIIEGKLANEGIDCIIANENFSNLMPIYNAMPGGGVQIQVREEDFEKARNLIIDEIEPQNDKIICPKCGSDKYKLRSGNGRFRDWTSAIVALVTATPFANIKPNYYCKDCNAFIK